MNRIALAVTGLTLLASSVVVAGPVVPGGGFVDNTTVYDNSASSITGLFATGVQEWEIADPITLAGTARYVTNIRLQIYSNQIAAATADVTIRIYGSAPPSSGTWDPGAPLWESGLLTGQSFANGVNGYDYAVPEILVGDQMVWSIQISNVVTVGGIAPARAGQASVGSNTNRYSARADPSQSFGVYWLGPSLWASFGATITAIDDPSGGPIIPLPTGAAMAVLGMGLVGVRRRR